MKNSVRVARREKKMTQEGFADLLNVSRQTIISIESSRYVPSTTLSLKIARFLGKRVEDLFELEDSDLK